MEIRMSAMEFEIVKGLEARHPEATDTIMFITRLDEEGYPCFITHNPAECDDAWLFMAYQVGNVTEWEIESVPEGSFAWMGDYMEDKFRTSMFYDDHGKSEPDVVVF